jgi:hypothetical protein
VVRANNGAQKVKPLRAALHDGFVGVYFKREMVTQKHINGFALGYQRFGAVGQQHKVVNIAHVAPHLECVLDEVVEFMQVNVGKELAAQAANGQAFAGRCVKQRLVRRHLFEQLPLAAEGGRRVNRVLRQDGMHHLVQALARRLVVRQFGQGFVPKLAQYGAVYAGEKRPYVELAISLVAGLAHEVLQPVYGRLGSFAFAVGKAVVNEARVPPRLNVPNQPLVHQPVCKGGRKDFTQLRVGDGKNRQCLRSVRSLRNGACLGKHNLGQIDEVRAFVFAVARLGSASKQFTRNVGSQGGQGSQGKGVGHGSNV